MSATQVEKVFNLGGAAVLEARLVLFVLAYHADFSGHVDMPPWKVAAAAGLDLETTEGQLSALARVGVYSPEAGRLCLDLFPPPKGAAP
jgi:hypothetical protein